MGNWVVSGDNWKYEPSWRAQAFKMCFRNNYRRLHGKHAKRWVQLKKVRKKSEKIRSYS